MPTLWIVLLTCLLLPAAPTAADGNAEIIVYAALRPAHWDLYLLVDGKAPKRLTTHPALDYNATFSPDGRWLVFTSERRGQPDLYALDLDAPGSSPQPLTRTPFLEDAAAVSPDGRRLVFVSTRAGNADVWRMPFRPGDVSTVGEAVNLTRDEAGDFNPSFSPDGTRIVFSSNRHAYGPDTKWSARRAAEIYVMGADGSAPTRLTDASGWDGSPVFSADGEEIFFYSERDGGVRIFRMRADGSDVKGVTKSGRAVSPAVADGGRVFYAARDGSRWRIRSSSADGKDTRDESDAERHYWAPAYDRVHRRWVAHGAPLDDQRPYAVEDEPLAVDLPGRRLEVRAVRSGFPALDPSGRRVVHDYFGGVGTSDLTGGEARELHRPARDPWAYTWSTDGRWIAFAAGPGFAGPSTRVDIWKVPAAGGEAVNLTADSPANDALPDFSPDGKHLVFRSGRDGNDEIYLMKTDGRKTDGSVPSGGSKGGKDSDVRRLTRDPATDTMPTFSPRGGQIVFTSDRAGNFELYVLDLEDGAEPRRLTHHPGRDMHPAYSPDGDWIVFTSERGGLNDEQPLVPVFNPQAYGEIFALSLTDGKLVRLTHNKWEDGTPTWGVVRQ